MQVTIIEFIRPNADRVNRTYIVPAVLAEQVKAIEFEGCRLTLEDLNTGLWSVSLEHEDIGDFKIDLVTKENIQKSVEWLIEGFDQEEFDAWAQEMSQ